MGASTVAGGPGQPVLCVARTPQTGADIRHLWRQCFPGKYTAISGAYAVELRRRAWKTAGGLDTYPTLKPIFS